MDHIEICGQSVNPGKTANDISLDNPEITVYFSDPVEVSKFKSDMVYISGYAGILSCKAGASDNSVILTPSQAFDSARRYVLTFDKGSNLGLYLYDKFTFNLVTAYDLSDKYPRISDEELLDKVQMQTFKYFWDYAHPVSGLARERYGSDETVTTGGSGFGIMCIPVGVERGFITRADAAARMRTIVDFLENKAERFHGAYSHWLNGTSGKAIAFSTNDNGGDLVETGFLMEGLLTAKQYFSQADEADIREAIDRIWRGVEWDWYTRDGQNVLYWHWSPDKGWAMNMKIQGWNEALIIYVLAASSPTHPISADVYHKGWARDGSMKPSQNGPLFFAHYSFLGMNPNGLKDAYCSSYWDQNVAHAQYNYDYCVRNPGNHAGYSASCWGSRPATSPTDIRHRPLQMTRG